MTLSIFIQMKTNSRDSLSLFTMQINAFRYCLLPFTVQENLQFFLGNLHCRKKDLQIFILTISVCATYFECPNKTKIKIK